MPPQESGFGRLPTAIQGLQFRYQRSWKGLVRNPKADAGECYYWSAPERDWRRSGDGI